MPTALEQAVVELAKGKNFATLTTLLGDGTPMTHIMWVDCDDEYVLVNTEIERDKFRNVERDPRATVTIWDAESPYRYAEVRGSVVEKVTGDAAVHHIHALSRKYMGKDYDESNIGSERVILKIAPERQKLRG